MVNSSPLAFARAMVPIHPSSSRGVCGSMPATSDQNELAILAGRVPEQVRAKVQMPLVEAEAPCREAEAGGDLLGVGSAAALPQPEGGDIVLAAVHRFQDVDHA